MSREQMRKLLSEPTEEDKLRQEIARLQWSLKNADEDIAALRLKDDGWRAQYDSMSKRVAWYEDELNKAKEREKSAVELSRWWNKEWHDDTKRLEAELAEQKDVTRRYYDLLAKEQAAHDELKTRFDALGRERAIVGEALDAERANAYQEERARARGVEAALAKRSGSRHRMLLAVSKVLGELREEAKNRKHYSDSPRSVLHSWEDHENLDEIGGTCGLCEVLAGEGPDPWDHPYDADRLWPAEGVDPEPDPYADRDPNQWEDLGFGSEGGYDI